MRQRRADRFERTPPREGRSVPKSTASKRTAYVFRERPSDSRAQMGRPFSRADARTTRRPSRRLPDNVAGTFKREAGTTQEYERHGSSDREYPGELPTFASRRSQYRWQEQVDNQATAEKKEELLSYEEHNSNNSSMESTQQPEISKATVAEWAEAVAIVAIDAELNQGTFRGRSMDSGRVSSRVWSPPVHAPLTQANGTRPPMKTSPTSPPSEGSKTGSGTEEPTLQPESDDASKGSKMPAFRDDKDGNHNVGIADSDIGNKDEDMNTVEDKDEHEDEDENEGEDEGDQDGEDKDSSGGDSCSTSSTFSALELLEDGFLLDMVRRSRQLGPAMLELPKQRILRSEEDFEIQKLKTAILRASKKAEQHYNEAKQHQKEAVEHHGEAERQVAKVQALATMLNDMVEPSQQGE
ncbi:MAG: hypothetical protein Q9226_000989 [Calogaya cf. arnoldii]